jgi:hypothetical protein
MNFEAIILSENKPITKQILSDSTYWRYLVKIIEAESGIVGAGVGRGFIFNGYRVMEIDGGGGGSCTTFRIYLMSLNCTLKNS